MASGNAVWGIDIGQCGLKAIKLRAADDGKVEAVAFDVIDHPKILSQPDADRDELINSALEKFANRNDWQGDQFIVGVPGQQTFARFCKMPPIDLKKDSKKIHDLVRYEASQQIPFDMEDVVWDYQIFTSEDSPDVEVGIFAIRKDLIRKHLNYFAGVGIAPTGVQTVPAALYNFCQFDGHTVGEGAATVIIDVGAQNTDLIIVESNSAWTRNIPLGGNSFTEALVRAFKLSFAKAESLKRSAADSKYARQIFQAMRPVFADLVAEIQRSIGFFSSTHRETELKHVLALGNAFRLPGLQKYLENNLTISGGVVKLEQFSKLLPTATVNAPQFKDNLLAFAPAYGLALQGLGLGQISASLLPPELARVAVWRKKRPYFIATAATLLIAAGVPLGANTLDMQALESPGAQDARSAAKSIINEASNLQRQYQAAQQDTSQQEQDIESLRKLQEDKLVIPRLIDLVYEALPPVSPPELTRVDSAEELKELLESDPERYARTQRGQLLIEQLNMNYVEDVTKVKLETPTGGGPSPGRGAAAGGGGRGASRGGRGGRGMARGGGGRGRMGPVQPAQSPGPSPAAPSGQPANAGFVVQVSGRLMQGTRPSEAAEWVRGTYINNLRTLSQREGLGFYIPEDDPQNASDAAISLAPIVRYHGADLGLGLPGQPPGRVGGDEVRFPDPLTGEETFNDWRVEFSFKVHLGEAPEEEQAEGSPEAPAGPARSPRSR